MITTTYILNNLATIESLFSNSNSINESLLYSKLAILELCGWVEECMDDIIQTFANLNLKNIDNREFVKNYVIGKTYGFEYNRHFRRMLMQTIGIIKLEKLEGNLDAAKFQPMHAALETLKSSRDTEAHTHIQGVTKRLDAPSVIKNRFLTIHEGLKDIDDKLKRMKL